MYHPSASLPFTGPIYCIVSYQIINRCRQLCYGFCAVNSKHSTSIKQSGQFYCQNSNIRKCDQSWRYNWWLCFRIWRNHTYSTNELKKACRLEAVKTYQSPLRMSFLNMNGIYIRRGTYKCIALIIFYLDIWFITWNQTFRYHVPQCDVKYLFQHWSSNGGLHIEEILISLFHNSITFTWKLFTMNLAGLPDHTV